MEDLIEKHGVADGCRNLTDIVRRYDRLDLIFERAKQEGRLRTMEEVNPGCFREEGGVLIHVGPEGELFFGGLGAHRFAIARILKLPLPAMIGCVHVSAIPYLTQLRQEIEDQSGFISGELWNYTWSPTTRNQQKLKDRWIQAPVVAPIVGITTIE